MHFEKQNRDGKITIIATPMAIGSPCRRYGYGNAHQPQTSLMATPISA
jgi:hypothetical protein